MFANLEKGSRNHLRSFVRQLTSRGSTFTPTVLPAAEVSLIVGTPIERGAAA